MYPQDLGNYVSFDEYIFSEYTPAPNEKHQPPMYKKQTEILMDLELLR